MFGRILKAIQRGPEKFEGATITIAEQSAPRWRGNDQEAYVKRFVGTSAFCASYNARKLAECNFVLYRRARKPKRAAGRRSLDWMRKTGPEGPGAKVNAQVVSDDIEVVEESPILELMRDPNAMDTGFEFWEFHHLCKEFAGNAYAFVWFDGKQPRLESMAPQWTRIVPSTNGIVVGYIYGRSREIEQTFAPDEVVHERFSKSFYSPYYGAGPLAQAVQAHDIRTAMNEWNLKVFDKMARPDYAIVFKQALTDKQKTQAREEIKRRYQGMENAGEVMILSGGEADIKPLGWSPKDLDYKEGIKSVDTEICTAFGIPETFLRPNDGALSQAKAMSEWYYRNTLLPRAIKHQEWLNERIIPLFTDSDEYFFVVDNPVPQDEAAQATRAQVLVSSGIITPNEGRYINGFEQSEEEGADILRVNGVPLDKVGAMPVFGGTNGSGTDGGGTDGAGDAGGGTGSDAPVAPASTDGEAVDIEAGSDAGKSAGDDASRSCSKVGNGCCGVEVKQSELWRKDQASPLYRASVDPMEQAARDYFNAQRDETLANMDAKPSGYQKGGRMAAARKDQASAEAEARRLLSVWGIDDPKWVKYLADRMVPLANDRMKAAAVQGIRYVQEFAAVVESAKPENFTLQNPRAASWAMSNTADLLEGCRSINQTTAETIGSSLAEGILQGESIGKLKARVKEAYDSEGPSGETMSEYRSMMIARTETARAQVNGTYAGWEATEVVEGKQWLLSPDSCEFCEAAAKQYGDANTPLNVSFYPLGSTVTGTQGGTMRMDFASVDGAPLHPNCFLPGTRVRASGVVAAYSAQYSGPIIKVSLECGSVISVTPNHPFLTRAGFIRAGDLQVGDDLLDALACDGADNPDTNDVNSTIEEAFSSLSVASGMSPMRVPVSPEYLHRDGAFIDKHIDVVASKSLLVMDIESNIVDPIANLPLCFGWSASRLDGLSGLASVLVRLSFAAHRRMARCGKCGSFLWGQAVHSHESGFGSVAVGDSDLSETIRYNRSGYPEPSGDSENRFAGLVGSNKVVNVERADYSGHVYDLQTESGLYIAGNAIVSNCKCSVVPYIKGYGPARPKQ